MPNRFPLLLFFGWALLGGARGLAITAPGLRGSLGAHDPGTIVKCKDRYYLFYTGQGIPSKSSADKIFWTEGPPVFATANSTATTLTWPGWAGAMKLYTATNLIQPITWNLVTNPAVLSNGMQIISTPTAPGAAFYHCVHYETVPRE